jgi:hypothetical protein
VDDPWQFCGNITKFGEKKKKTLLFSDQILRLLIGGLLDQLAPGFVYIFNLSLRGIEPVVLVVSLIA